MLTGSYMIENFILSGSGIEYFQIWVTVLETLYSLTLDLNGPCQMSDTEDIFSNAGAHLWKQWSISLLDMRQTIQ
jgi:hypothetical protein